MDVRGISSVVKEIINLIFLQRQNKKDNEVKELKELWVKNLKVKKKKPVNGINLKFVGLFNKP